MSNDWPEPLPDTRGKKTPNPLRVVRVGDAWGTEEIVDDTQKATTPDFIRAAGNRRIEPARRKKATPDITMDGDFEVEAVHDPRIAQVDRMQREARENATAAVESSHATPARDEQSGQDHRNDGSPLGVTDRTAHATGAETAS